jgi:hypothetical protein
MEPTEGLSVELGARLEEPIRVEWDTATLREAAAASWRLTGELDGERIAELRVLSAAFEDGSLLGVAGLRPSGAAGHDADELSAILARPEGEPDRTSDVRLSIEYDGAGRPRRLGLELYADPDAPPLRVAGDRREDAADPTDPGAVSMTFRLDGTPGAGAYELKRVRAWRSRA